MAVTSKLLNDNKFSNIMKNKYCIVRVCVCVCVCEKLLAENHGDSCCRNFTKQELWKVQHVKLFLVKQNSIFREGYYSRKDDIFPFTEALPLISF